MSVLLAGAERPLGRGELALAALAGLALALGAALPDLQLRFNLLGTAPGSTTTGIAFYATELVAWVLGLGTLAYAKARRRVTRGAWVLALLWSSALAWGAWQGLRQGYLPRGVLAELRALLLVPALLGLVALRPRAWVLALCAGAWGLVAGFAGLGLLLVLEPTGFANLSVVPVSVLMLPHALPLALLPSLALLALLLRQSSQANALRAFALGLLWCLLWLTFVRGLWVALGAATLALGLGALLSGQRKQAGRLLGWQALAALAGLLLALGLQRMASPDGAYLLKFRLQRLAQAAHLATPPPVAPQLGPPYSSLFQGLARKGGLYRNLAGAKGERSAVEQRVQDPSLSDRALMTRFAWQSFAKQPVRGAGLGSVLHYTYVEGMDRVTRDPHNGYLWLLKCGLAGLLAGLTILLLPLVGGLIAARRSRSGQALWALGGLGFLAASELFHTGWLQVPALLAWALVAAAALRPEDP